MKIFGITIGNSLNEQIRHDPQLREEYMDGFRTGCPLVGQPEYPTHGNSRAYRHGLKLGKQAHDRAGRPAIQYEDGTEEE